MAIDSFVETFSPVVIDDPELAFLDRDFVVVWLRRLRSEIATAALSNGCGQEDFACTFLAAVVGPVGAVYVQVGDGAIVVAGAEIGEYSWVFWPQHGEFANSTNFVTQQDAETVLEVEVTDNRVDEVAIFTDGIERLVLDMHIKSVHSPALRPMFGWLAAMEPCTSDGPSPALEAFLGSSRVNDRTDDDKTLAMATRARPLAFTN